MRSSPKASFVSLSPAVMPDVDAPHAVPAAAVLLRLGTDRESGLDGSAVRRLRAQYGLNELAEEPPPPPWSRLASQFKQLVYQALVD